MFYVEELYTVPANYIQVVRKTNYTKNINLFYSLMVGCGAYQGTSPHINTREICCVMRTVRYDLNRSKDQGRIEGSIDRPVCRI